MGFLISKMHGLSTLPRLPGRPALCALWAALALVALIALSSSAASAQGPDQAPRPVATSSPEQAPVDPPSPSDPAHASPRATPALGELELQAEFPFDSAPEEQSDSDLRNDIVSQVPEIGEARLENQPEVEADPAPVPSQPGVQRPMAAPGWSRMLPSEARLTLHRWIATGLEELGLYELATSAYVAWIALAPEQVAAWHGLARVQVRGGSWATGETALFRALQLSDLLVEPEARRWTGTLSRDLAELYMLQTRYVDAVTSLELAAELQPYDPRVLGLLARARHQADPETHAAPATNFQPWPPASSVLRVRALVGGGALLVLLLFSAIIRALRGSGDLIVSISYPSELKGEFSVRLSRQRTQRTRTRPESGGSPASSRTAHHLIARETHFRRVRATSYYVCVEGVLLDPDTEGVLTSPFEERNVIVYRGKTARLEFDLSPRECPVDVRVLWDKRPVKDASVASRGYPQSLRYTRDGDVRLRLPKGTHTIAVGSGDRVAERALVVQSFQPSQLTIDLAGSEDLIFKGCPPAVTPYLHGDLSAAARALELDGHTKLSHLIQARLHHERGQAAQAARHFELAGRLVEAAELQMHIKKFASAAELFERARDPLRAAEMHRSAGNDLRAGTCYEQAEEYVKAAESFEQAGDSAQQVSALERASRPYEAAEVALQNHDRGRAIKLLQQVGSEDINFASACRMLVEAFEHEGHLDLAADRLERLVEAGIQDDLPQLYSKLADLLEASDQIEKALDALATLREIAPTYPNVAGRIETLRKRRSQGVIQPPGGVPTGAPTAFKQPERYQILKEIGRGGMGVVFEARDTRLKRVVALKRLPESMKDHPKAIELFMREAQSAARLNHTNIVTVYDTDQAPDGTFFITMELLSGHPLNVILHKRGRLKVRDVTRVAIQIANGLSYAHEQRIIHRDIKTANLFFTSDQVVKIMDFGLAKMVEEVRRGTTIVGGTPFYMAPEQGIGGSVDHRADIYAFGVTLYELLTGSLPFPSGDVTYHHRHTAPPDPRTKVRGLPMALVELVLSMMEKKPEDRCGSAAEVRTRLKELL